ncbi:MAG: AmmeMemoRadiSam system protein B [Desulfuromonas sp.]|nr:MAG: AmmeMemoRadiSam system protein B [Desulfuromonas sp.]
MRRQPAVAGQFYPADASALAAQVWELMPESAERRAVALLAPHAGYIYSGKVAGKTFAAAQIPDQVVLLGPNHHGIGARAAIDPSEAWVTPLGAVSLAQHLAAELCEASPRFTLDATAHQHEHSLEVMLPFLQMRSPSLKILPISFSRLSLVDLIEIGEILGDVLLQQSQRTLIVASSDMTHFESGAQARRKDYLALETILALDPEGLYATVCQHDISMCGMVSSVVMLAAAKRLGAKRGELIDYANSGAVTGDESRVVAYAGALIH